MLARVMAALSISDTSTAEDYIILLTARDGCLLVWLDFARARESTWW